MAHLWVIEGQARDTTAPEEWLLFAGEFFPADQEKEANLRCKIRNGFTGHHFRYRVAKYVREETHGLPMS